MIKFNIIIYSIKITIIFKIIPPQNFNVLRGKNHRVFWHNFKNSVAVEIGLFYSQKFTNNRDHFFIIVELTICQVAPRSSKFGFTTRSVFKTALVGANTACTT
jgi:hypothetical protein